MRPVKVRPRWRCDFCNRTSSSIPGMERHERICWKNPNRYCPLCEGTGVQEDDYRLDPVPCYYCSQFDPLISNLVLVQRDVR
jgi:hypothetical protein